METKHLKEFLVSAKSPIKKFVEQLGLDFVKGNAFYQLTKKETIQNYKSIVAKRKSDGNMISGEELREVLKIPKDSVKKITVDHDDIPDFDIFVQSTSYNRVLLPNTKFLYKTHVDGEEKNVDGETQPTKRKSSEVAKDVTPVKQKKKDA